MTMLLGQLTVLGDQALATAERGAVVKPDESGHWEIVIEEFEAFRNPYVLQYSFAEVAAAVTGRFDEFVTAVAPWRSTHTPAAGLAAYVVWSATVGAAGFLQRPGVLMSKHWMDKVWSWDHCFNALALAQGRPELALDQFLTPFDHQDEGGALPDSITHSEVLYNFVKPPIHGWALQGLRQRLPKDLDPADLEAIYQRLSAWTRFWLDTRRAPGHALAHYQHGNDSGWDNSTVFDQARVIETADLAAFLSQQMHVLAGLATELDLPDEAQVWAASSDQMQQAMLDELWNGDSFAAKDPRTGELHAPTASSTCCPSCWRTGYPARWFKGSQNDYASISPSGGWPPNRQPHRTTGRTVTGADRSGHRQPCSWRTGCAAPASMN